MGMVVRTNVPAMNAQRQLGINNSQVSKSLEKLSSGFRINRAADDASGLAISEKMKAQIKGLETASANSQDGISLIQTAEGGAQEIHDMLNRMTELATKSANGTIQNQVDREAIQREVNDLNDEITRISKSTNFNGINLLDGNLSGSGSASGASTTSKLSNYTYASVSGAGTAITGTEVAAAVNEQMTIDGVVIDINWAEMSAEDKATLTQDWTANTSVNAAKKAASVVENFMNAAITKHNAANGTSVAAVKFTATSATAFKLEGGTKTRDSVVKFHETGTPDTASATGFAALLVNGADTTAATTASAATALPGNGESFTMSIGGVATKVSLTGAITGGTAADATQLQTDLQTAAQNYLDSSGDTSFAATDIIVKATNDGRLEIVNNTGKSISFGEFEGGEAASKLGLSGSSGSSGGLTLQIGDTSDSFNKVTVSVDNLSAAGIGTEGINVSNQDAANGSIDKIKAAINKVSTNRANLGSLQNRLEHTINNLDTTAENMTSANSRIRDTDMAKEMMNYTKMNVLTQAAQAMLAQANQQPQSILQLLQ